MNAELTQFLEKLDSQHHRNRDYVPTKLEVERFVESFFDLFFGVDRQLTQPAGQRYIALMTQLKALLRSFNVDSTCIVEGFSAHLPLVHTMLLSDAKAALAFDPAAESLEEVIACYPGFYAIAVYRLAHHLSLSGVPLLPRMLSTYAQSKTGIDIHPTAQIGRSFVIDHGTGVVIGATARIGNHVTLYHGVTLGALQVKKSQAQTKRHPTIEDHVAIYANATVLGGGTVIGQGSVIGANAWVTKSVSPNSLLYFNGQATVKRSKAQRPVPTKRYIAVSNLMEFFKKVDMGFWGFVGFAKG